MKWFKRYRAFFCSSSRKPSRIHRYCAMHSPRTRTCVWVWVNESEGEAERERESARERACVICLMETFFPCFVCPPFDIFCAWPPIRKSAFCAPLAVAMFLFEPFCVYSSFQCIARSRCSVSIITAACRCYCRYVVVGNIECRWSWCCSRVPLLLCIFVVSGIN